MKSVVKAYANFSMLVNKISVIGEYYAIAVKRVFARWLSSRYVKNVEKTVKLKIV